MRNFILIVFRWSECSRSCGGGIRSSKRNCTNPTPQGGGLYCIGSRVRYESCNTWECPRGSQDPRLQQCQKFNGNNFKITGIECDGEFKQIMDNVQDSLDVTMTYTDRRDNSNISYTNTGNHVTAVEK